MTHQKVWLDQDIAVLGVTGEYSSGKTLFLLTIDPENTILFDFEKSAGAYEGLGVERVDMPQVMAEKKKGFTQADLFEEWLKQIKALPENKYTVIAADPISDIEDGMVEYVKSRYKDYGFKSADKFVSTGGIFWSKVKAEWKNILVELSTKCQTFAFSSHLKVVWRNERPTSKKVPKGKSTLMELATLYLYLDREADKRTGEVPLQPRAIVLKTRLSKITKQANGDMDIRPLFPPQIPVATPKAIREYILNPPDYGNLKPEEVYVEPELSEEDRLALQVELAEKNKEAAETALKVEDKRDKAARLKQEAMDKLRPSPDKSSEVREDQKKEGENHIRLLDEDKCKDLLNRAHKADILDAVMCGLSRALYSRSDNLVSVTKENAIHSCQLLTEEEFQKFDKHIPQNA